jgi:Carbamoyl-phosphate synthase L chain, ATP binding domain
MSAGAIKPKVLIIAFQENWVAIARLPKALQQAGFAVAALCPPNSYLAATKYLDGLFPCCSRRSGRKIFNQLKHIVHFWKPEIIVPGDERAVDFLLRLVQLHHQAKNEITPEMLECLRFSFGNFNWQAAAMSKCLTLSQAATLGIKTPKFGSPSSFAEAVHLAEAFGWPVIMKKSSSFGGRGVAFCANQHELAGVYRQYAKPYWKRTLASMYANAQGWELGLNWSASDHGFTVNETIGGTPAAAAVVAVNGKILARSAALKTKCYPDFKSPSSVIQMINHEGIFAAVEKLVGHWKATGFIGFDFMVTQEGTAYLIECNPRPTPLSYLGASSGCDLCLAWRHYLTGEEKPPGPTRRHEFVVHFPNEWQRDPNSPYLQNAYHDVPWDDPPLFRRLVADLK